MKIEFLDATKRLNGERRSKLLKPGSDLYNHVDSEYKKLVSKFGNLVGSKRMDSHIELIGRNEKPTDELLVERAIALEGTEVDIDDTEALGRAWVLFTDKNRKHHVTIAFFPNGVPDGIF